jgi:hypothetical protein
LEADFRKAQDDLLGAIGSEAEDRVTQRLAEALGRLTWFGSDAQLDALGIQASPGIVLPASDPRAPALQEAIARRDRAEVRAVLLEVPTLPPALIDRILDSLFLDRDDVIE